MRELAYQMFAAALNDGNGLAAKWAPREKTNRESHRACFKAIKRYRVNELKIGMPADSIYHDEIEV
jgi:hypothetical protein